MRILSAKKIVNTVLLVGFFLFIVIYTHSRTAFLSQGANLEVTNISDGEVVYEPTLTITGIALRATKLTINGRELVIDEQGNFTDTLIFAPGLNNVEIIAEDKYGKGDDLKYEILYQEQDQETLNDLIARKNSHVSMVETNTEDEESSVEEVSETEENQTSEEPSVEVEESLSENNNL